MLQARTASNGIYRLPGDLHLRSFFESLHFFKVFTSWKTRQGCKEQRGSSDCCSIQKSPAALRLHLLHHFCSLIAHRFDHLNHTGISIPVSIPRRSCICLHIDAGTCRIGGSFVPAVADLTRTAGPLIQRTLLAPLWPNAEHPAISLSLSLSLQRSIAVSSARTSFRKVRLDPNTGCMKTRPRAHSSQAASHIPHSLLHHPVFPARLTLQRRLHSAKATPSPYPIQLGPPSLESQGSVLSLHGQQPLSARPDPSENLASTLGDSGGEGQGMTTMMTTAIVKTAM